MFRKIATGFGFTAVGLCAIVGAFYIVGYTAMKMDEAHTAWKVNSHVEEIYTKAITCSVPSDSTVMFAAQLESYLSVYANIFTAERRTRLQGEVRRLNCLYIAHHFDKGDILEGLYFCQLKDVPPREALRLCSGMTFAWAVRILEWRLEDLEDKKREGRLNHAYLTNLHRETARWKWMLENNATSPTNE